MASVPRVPPAPTDQVSFTPAATPAPAQANQAIQSSTGTQALAATGLGGAKMASSQPASPYSGSWLGV
jgi:hypothetical protein